MIEGIQNNMVFLFGMDKREAKKEVHKEGCPSELVSTKVRLTKEETKRFVVSTNTKSTTHKVPPPIIETLDDSNEK